ncbi:MAG: PilZ domain-containing protein [Blastocatellia bacterium]
MKTITADEIASSTLFEQMIEQAPEVMPEISVSDRRKYVARIPIEISLRVASFRFSAPARTIDVSVSGLQVRTQLPLTLGERVILTFHDSGEQVPLNICAEVVRVDAEAEADSSALLRPESMAQVFSEVARLSVRNDLSAAPGYGLRILRDDSAAWQNFVRMQVLS